MQKNHLTRALTFFFSLTFLFVTQTYAQQKSVTLSGLVKDKATKENLPYVNVVLKAAKDSTFITGTVTNEEGRFSLNSIPPENYILETAYLGYTPQYTPLYVGNLSEFLDIAHIELTPLSTTLTDVVVTVRQDDLSAKLDKKTFSIADNISQAGGSVLQSMQNLPGITVQEGKVQLRGNDKVTVLIDGKQTAMTGFGSQTGLDNIPASAIDKIEIINNPSAKYDANGNAGIINIIMKKEKQEGFNGKIGFTGGLGSLWQRRSNLPGIRPQYQFTPKLNPSLSFNYRKNKINVFFQADNLYNQSLNKNEFVTRTYDDGSIIQQQTKRNRNTNYLTAKAGLDWYLNARNTLTVSTMFGSEKIIDRGDEPFFNADLSQRKRLWQFLEDELKTTVMATAVYQHKFKQPGHVVNAGINYTFHRENEQYFFDNIMPTYTGKDAFKLLSDEHVADLNLDYIKPLAYGRLEGGFKFRYRTIPTNMLFIPGRNSPLDTNAGGWAKYTETIPTVYGNYIFENPKIEAEIGLRIEYVGLQYDVNPGHNTYKSDGYHYTQPFPNLRFAYKFDEHNRLSFFYNRRVDRPNEVDIRIFPKYDDAEIIKVGNPALRPQFTNSLELGYKNGSHDGYVYAALYHRMALGTITRIASTVPGSELIYAIFQNAGKSYNTGIEAIWDQKIAKAYRFNLNATVYRNQIDAFTVSNLYPVPNSFTAAQQEIISGNVKLNNMFQLGKNLKAQLTAVYWAPDIIPQGKMYARFSIDMGIQQQIQKGKGSIFINASDLLNTMVSKKRIYGNGFQYLSTDYYETQVFRIGYNYKF
ncbi:TonB-dependent receptor [Taibaiella sp. KBW10]|uniref:outer membrane beta-barrel family protein n=1 Tax=Taibaiella sp. KBW10 TaxID=2153357 RepID=UPI000F591EC4|nr:outer membrane beta-barrel family protein [Taibaiella sp. KBW10]RQO32668.1 TonB-dependent receptor [Taibaiella sp. KBW10]